MMITLVKWIIVFTLTIPTQSQVLKLDTKSKDYPVNTRIDSTTNAALSILVQKCNVCHTKHNRKRIFSSENMNVFRKDIYKQVFIKKRMPKGKKIKLSRKEYQQLLTWISFTKNKTYGN